MSRRSVWPVWLLAAPAFVAIWSGWVELGTLTGFGEVQPLPGVWDSLVIDSRITLPIGMEAYAALALRAWLRHDAPPAARSFARASAIAALGLGAAGQVATHLMAAAGVTRAPWPVTVVVACLPVAVLGMGAALAHLLHAGQVEPTPGGFPHNPRGAANGPHDLQTAGHGHADERAGGRKIPSNRSRSQNRGRRPNAAAPDTRARVAELASKRPDVHADDVAAALGVSPRTARRHMAALRSPAGGPARGAGRSSQRRSDDVPATTRERPVERADGDFDGGQTLGPERTRA